MESSTSEMVTASYTKAVFIMQEKTCENKRLAQEQMHQAGAPGIITWTQCIRDLQEHYSSL